MQGVKLERTEKWSAHASARPVWGDLAGGGVSIGANGTRTCSGGWQFVYSGIEGGAGYRIRTRVRHEGLASPRDCLGAIAYWDAWPAESCDLRRPWNSLLPRASSDGCLELECAVRAPQGATTLTVRCIFRWEPAGVSYWDAPQISPVEIPRKEPVRVCVVTATRQTRERMEIESFSKGLGLADDVAQSVDLWASLCKEAARRGAQLVVTPEVAVGGRHSLEGAVEADGPATVPFRQMAAEHGCHIVLAMREREPDGTAHNSAVLVSPAGEVAGIYRKVHLAHGEDMTGIVPGDTFPVFETAIGRIGCLICMDTTVSESARMIGLNGADFLCFPIMGDLRSDRFSLGQPVYNEGRWKAIMRTRALDNQLCMVVARNDVQGSCIINRKGDILAWNEGYEEFTSATVLRDDGYILWNGGDFRETTWMLRRPHLYSAYVDPDCLGPLTR
jgi:predicted amidohydrolase